MRRGLGLLAFLAPALVFVVVFTYYPLLRGSQMAFQQWNLYDLRNTPFVGLDNFRTLLANPTFWTVLRNSVVWVVGSIVPQLLIGFGLALLLRKRFRFRGVYQALVFFPWAVSGFLIGILFRWMFNGEFGVVNDLLRKAGLIDTNVAWLADPELAMFSVVVANVWYGVTFFAIMILAALQSVPDELLEAGALDGAGKARTLFFIVIPFIRTTLLLTVLLRVIWVFNFPEIIYGMTGGGPAEQTHIVTSWMINFTSQGDYGLASALGLIVLAVLVLFTTFYLLALKERDAR
ncbi:carbohydrate ABC transporter permease [Microlunatus capsulatus]|uniref:Multiple sugar transport system permease protein n=1 Tax=Microlunatus capsulatus TaxID=99117 RepID=A0ABS4Z9D0_9ACTN|nr:sugar ABC transporter permease [Microlunatus capsulatus]MBP2417661.1 multiple sugar transport system permease protein [Microlunatus capsulatus]